jgi:protein-S-isoprenylcysteine O-methyltransferase Ste14
VIEVLLAFSGYAWGMLHDLAARHRTPRVKPLLLALSAAGHLAAWYRLARYSPRFHPPRLLRALCIVLAPAATLAMLYSIAIEIPFRKAWVEQGHTEELVTTGTYALTRHPGVLWYAIATFAWAVALGSRRLLLVAPLLIGGDIAHVGFQERAVLGSLFGEAYEDYQRETPFVMPNMRSLRRFLSAAGIGAIGPSRG